MLRNVIPRRRVARRKNRCFTLSSRSIAASASTIVRLLQMRMNVFNPVRGTFRIWFGVAHGPPNQILNVPLTGLNTFILICSSLTMVEAFAAAEKDDQRRLRLFLLATLVLGIIFVSIQAYEYQKLYFQEGLTFKSAPDGVNPLYGATFYAQTGVHGSHVIAGVLALAYVTRKAFKGAFTKENHEAVELVGLYWHFVDVVWIFLFPIVYLLPA